MKSLKYEKILETFDIENIGIMDTLKLFGILNIFELLEILETFEIYCDAVGGIIRCWFVGFSCLGFLAVRISCDAFGGLWGILIC